MSTPARELLHDPRDAIALFEELLETDDSGQRQEKLENVKQRNPVLAAKVAKMIAADEEESVLERRHLIAAATPSLDKGYRIGPYCVTGMLGSGGMGVVYLAERADNAFEQQVAIKLVHALGQGEELTRRFALERQLLARLEHPGITRILDAGTTRDGSAYLVMEYAPGENLDVYCDRLELSLGERLRLVCEVCEVVHHAHRKLVVHRDLKPSNILVTVDGRIKLLDFGIAKLVEREGGESSTQTVAGTQPFTPDYASPEQILGDAVSTATDVYSLGVVLYELLTGERPFRVETRSPGELVKSAELRRMELPSKRFSRLDPDSARRRAALRSSQPRIVEVALTGDLDRIVAKALDPDPELRYTSIDRLADDLQRFLAGLPVRARRATWQYRSRKFISRHRILVSSIVSVSLLILGGFGTAVWQWQEALTAGERAELAASRMQSTNRFLVSLFEAGNPRWNVDRKHKGPETRILDVLEEASRRLDTDLATGPVERADLHHVLGDAFLAVGLGDRATSHFERSSELRQAALGELHEDTARALYYEATVAPTLRQQISKLRRSIEIETRLERPSSNFPYALIDGAWRLMLAGQIEEAISWLERGRAIVERDFPDAHPLRNLIVLRDLELAILTGRLELTESFPELVASPDASFAETTEIQRAAIEGYRARSALLRGRIEDAILLFRSALARSFKVTENAQGFAAQRWRALLVQALLLSEALDEAEREAEGLNPDDDLESGSYFDVPALLGRANLSRARGNLPGCERRARKAMALIRREVVNPNLIAAQAQTVLGECLLAGGDSAGAAEILEDSHRLLAEILGPENWEVRRVGRLVNSTRKGESRSHR